MTSLSRRTLVTLGVMLYALWPGSAKPPEPGEGTRTLTPHDMRGGLGRFLDGRGELSLFFPYCASAAAPFLLFRLKRCGFSRCRAVADAAGLTLTARR